MTHDLPFKPCSDNCPAVTGKSFGSVRYCPMQEQARHHAEMAAHPDAGSKRPVRLRGRAAAAVARFNGNPVWEGYDWRVGKWIRITTEVRIDEETGEKYIHFEPKIPPAPDETDCCANFQCCAEKIKKSGLGEVFAALVGAAR